MFPRGSDGLWSPSRTSQASPLAPKAGVCTSKGEYQMTNGKNKTAADEAPLCMHVIGIGRTGAVYVEALLRTGEVEDLLADPAATFAALVVDIGNDDMGLAQDYGASFYKRLSSRGIPSDRFSFQSVALDAPSAEVLTRYARSNARVLEGRGRQCSERVRALHSEGFADAELGRALPSCGGQGGLCDRILCWREAAGCRPRHLRRASRQGIEAIHRRRVLQLGGRHRERHDGSISLGIFLPSSRENVR